MADDHETDDDLKDETDEEDEGKEDPVQFDEWVESVQSEVAYCATCQPYDSGECVWIFGQEMSWDDIFDNCDIPEDEELRERIARQIE